MLLYFHYSYSLFIKFFNQIHQLVFISINLHLISSGYYVAHVRQRQNISILMIVIKKVMGVSISFILISYCWRNSLKANQFVIFLLKSTQKFIYVHTQNLWANQNPLNPRTMVRHFLWNWTFSFNSKTSQNAESLKHHNNFLLELPTKYIVAHIFYIYIKFWQYEES